MRAMRPGTLYIVTASLSGPIRRIGVVQERKTHLAGHIYGAELHFIPSTGELDAIMPGAIRKLADLTPLMPASLLAESDPALAHIERGVLAAERVLERRALATSTVMEDA